MTHLRVENGTEVSGGWHVLSWYLLMTMVMMMVMYMIRIRIRMIKDDGDDYEEDGDDDMVILSGSNSPHTCWQQRVAGQSENIELR